MKLRALCLSLSLLAACSGSTPASTPDTSNADVALDAAADAPLDTAPAVDTLPVDSAPVVEPDVPEATAALIRARPYQSRVPSSYDGTRALPLVVVLHGYGASGLVQAAYLGLNPLYESRNFLLAYPDGTLNRTSQRFWNATNGCCDFAGQNVDDVAYVTAVIDDMAARYRVDPRRVYLVGHSNGGFMSHRMACDRSNRIAAIVSLAGAQWVDPMRCTPTDPVSVLQVHGTMDDTILYAGGSTVGGTATAYPSARDTVAAWARLNRCGDFAETGMRFDLVSDIAGEESHSGRHATCMGGAAELWTMDGAGHIPAFGPAWATAVYDWLEAHPKPAR